MTKMIASLAFAVPLMAAVSIVSESATGSRTSTQTILIDSTRMKSEMTSTSGEGATVLFLTDGGRDRMVLLDKTKNEYREIDQQSMAQMTGQMQGAMAQLNERLKNMPPEQRAMLEKMMKGSMPPGFGQAAKPDPISYKAVGSTTINGFACTMHEGTRGGEKVVEVCAAQPSQLKVSPADMQVFEKLKQFTAAMTDQVGNFARGIDQYFDTGVPGFPVRRVTYSGGQVTHRSEVKSVGRVNVGDADFSLGSARKVDLMPGQRAR
jgi:hypothetical protein